MNLIKHFVGGKITPGNSERKGKVFNPATDSYVNGFNISGAATTTSVANGGATAGDYISIRDRFTIAKGRVGVI